jgi:hypothetical protein
MWRWLEFDEISVKNYKQVEERALWGSVKLAGIRIPALLAVNWLAAAGPAAARLAVAWFTAVWFAAAWPGAASAQQMLPSAGGGLGSPSTMGNARVMPPQAQSLSPTYAPPPSSGAMPIPPMISAPAASPFPGGGGPQQVSLSLAARFGRDFPAPIRDGLVWRIFPAKPDSSGKFGALKERPL